MTEQEKWHLEYLAIILLIDSKAAWFPVNIFAIAKEYELIHLINNDQSLFQNMTAISAGILDKYGMNKDGFPEYLAIRVLSPIALLVAAHVSCPEDIYFLTGLPAEMTRARYNSYIRIISSPSFKLFNLEKKLISQFSWWIERRYRD